MGFLKKFKIGLIYFLVEFILLQPILIVVQKEYADAASPSLTTNTTTLANPSDPGCLTTAQNFFTDGTLPDFLTNSSSSGPDSGGEGPFVQEFDLNSIAQNTNNILSPDLVKTITSDAYVNQVINTYGPHGLAHYKSSDGKINVLVSCANSDSTQNNILDPALFDPILPISPDGLQLFSLLDNPNPKITFKNQLDYYALVGENCPGGLTKNASNPCPSFNPNVDDVFPNGVWDGPKADIRILRALIYLVTPISQGGAGREHIDVGRIIQYGKNDLLAPPPSSNGTATAATDTPTGAAGSSSTTGASSTSTSPPLSSSASTTSQLGYLVPQGLATQAQNSQTQNSALNTLNTILSATGKSLSPVGTVQAASSGPSGISSSSSSSSAISFPTTLGTSGLSISTPSTTGISTPTPTPPASNEAANSNIISKAYIDPNDDPVHPAHISTYLDIDEIDEIRVTTKTIEKHLFYSTVKYTYQAPFPIKVAWQTDGGLSQNPPPDFSSLSMLQMSKVSINGMIIDLLNQYGIGTLNMDVSKMNINNFGDVGMLVGESILEQLMNTPNGSMKGWSLASVVNSIGRAYLAAQLGLVPGALSNGDNYEQIVRNIGEKTIEYSMQFPSGSFKTASGNSADLVENIGRRYLESSVFMVSQGTLTPTPNYPINTLNDLLQRLGEGYIEAAFGLPAQSMRQNNYDKIRQSSFKATLLFPVQSSSGDYAADDYFTSKLGLGFIPNVNNGSISRYGFTKDQFTNPLVKLQTNQMDLGTFMRLIGSKAIENSVAQFSPAGLEQQTVDSNGSTTSTNGRIPTEMVGIKYLTGANAANVLAATGESNPPPSYNYQSVLNPSPNQADNNQNQVLPGCDNTEYGGNMHLFPGGMNYGTNGNAIYSTSDSRFNPNYPSGGSNIHFSADCLKYEVASPTKDLNPLQSIANFLNSDRTYTYSLSSDTTQTPPQPTDFPDSIGDPNRNYNDAYRNYIANNTIKSTSNTIAPYDGANQIINNSTPSDTISNAAQIPIMKVVSDDISFLKNDLLFQSRLQLLVNLYKRDAQGPSYPFPNSVISQGSGAAGVNPPTSTQNYFDLTPLVNLYGTDLDKQIINRLNRIIAYPTTQAQYLNPNNDPAYFSSVNDSTRGDTNGWLFTLNDLTQQIQCKINGGSYDYNLSLNAYSCNGGAGTSKISASDLYYAQQVISKIQNLETQFNALVNAYTLILNRGGASQQLSAQTITSSSIHNPSVSESVVKTINTIGQSGMSASIGIPGQIYQTDVNGMIDPNQTPLYNRDPMRMLVATNFKSDGTIDPTSSYASGSDPSYIFNYNLQKIGLVYAAEHFTTDAITQTKFVNQVLKGFDASNTSINDPNNAFSNAFSSFQQIGISDSSLTSSGLTISDFSRMFSLNLANSVFDRVGKQELLRVLWQKSGVTSTITNSKDYQNLVKDLNKASNDISFYGTRISDVQTKTSQLASLVESFAPLINNLGQKLGVIKAKKPSSSLTALATSGQNWESMQLIGQNYEVQNNQYDLLIQQAQKNDTNNSFTDRVKQAKILESDIKQDLEEIAAGKVLPRSDNQGGNSSLGSGNVGSTAATSCLNPNQIIHALTKSQFSTPGSIKTATNSITDSISEASLYVGGCRVDQALGMPNGSIYTWYSLGSHDYPIDVATTHPSSIWQANDGIWASIDSGLNPLSWVSQSYLDSLNMSFNNNLTNTTFSLSSLINPGSDSISSAGVVDLNSLNNTSLQPGVSINVNSPLDQSAGPITTSVSSASATSTATPTHASSADIPTWKKNNWTVGNFKLAIGLADAVNKGLIPNTDISTVYTLSSDQIKNFTQNGNKILVSIALVKLSSLIPGLSQFNKKYAINDQDLVSLLQGDIRPVIAKIGGVTLDKALGLPIGTGAALIFPPCFKQGSDGIAIAASCDGSSASQDPNNVRLLILARMGLRDLGIQIPDIPSGFDILAKGNMAQNWGNAQITQDLGLASNSLVGNFPNKNSPVRINNSYNSLMNAFGMDKTPFDQALLSVYQSLIQKLGQTINDTTTNPNTNSFILNDLQQISAIMQGFMVSSFLDPISNSQSDYWKNWGNANVDNTLAATDQAGLDEQNYVKMLGLLYDQISQLKDVNGNDLDSAGINSLRGVLFDDYFNNNAYSAAAKAQLVSGSLSINPNDVNSVMSVAQDLFPLDKASIIINPYKNILKDFRNRVNLLDSNYGVGQTTVDSSKNVIKYGDFEQFLQGNMTGDDLSKKIGEGDARGIVRDAIAKRIDAFIANGPKWLQDANAGLMALTANNATGCSFSSPNQSLSIGDLFGDMITQNNGCQFGGLSRINIHDILSSNSSNDQNFRLLVFNKLLSRTFSTHLEKELGIQYGTFQAMAVNPNQAPQILLDQGIIKASNQIFGSVNINDPCQFMVHQGGSQCMISTVKAALKSAFLNGFRDPSQASNPDSMGNYKDMTDFSTTRALQSLSDSMNKAVDGELKRLGDKFFGVGLTRADLSLFLQGNGEVFTFLGLQYAVNMLNKGLDSDPNTKNNPRKKFFEISYDDVRNSVIPSLKTGTLTTIQAQAKTDTDYNQLCVVGSAYLSSSDCYTYLNSQNNQLDSNSLMYWANNQLIAQITASQSSGGELNNIKTIAASNHIATQNQTQSQILDAAAVQTLNNYADQNPLQFLKDNNALNAAAVALNKPVDQIDNAAASQYLNQSLLSGDFLGTNGLTNKSLLISIIRSSDLSLTKSTKTTQVLSQTQTDAQSALKYKALDQIAFRFDQNIPVNFSARVLGVSAIDRTYVLVEYGLNMIADHNRAIQALCNITSNGQQDCSGLTSTIRALYDYFSNTGEGSVELNNLFKNGVLQNIDKAFSSWLGNVFGVNNVPTGLFLGIISWGANGFRSEDFNRSDITPFGNDVKVPAIGSILETTSINYAASWADHSLDMPAGTAMKMIQLAQVGINIYKLTSTSSAAIEAAWEGLDSAKKAVVYSQISKSGLDFAGQTPAQFYHAQQLKQLTTVAINLAIDIVINDLLGQSLTKVDQALGLPPSTMAQILTLGIQLLLTQLFPKLMAPMGPWGIGMALAFLAYTLVFGVVKVVVINRATADGYYPFYDRGTGESTKVPNYYESVENTNDYLTGEFDPTNKVTYYAALKNIAREKTVGVIRDLLNISQPGSYWMRQDPRLTAKQLVPVQIFTYGDITYTPFSDPLLARMPFVSDLLGVTHSSDNTNPWDSQCSTTPYFDMQLKQYMCDRPVGFRAGVFPDPSVTNSLIVTW
jgi:hypothetical protein